MAKVFVPLLAGTGTNTPSKDPEVFDAGKVTVFGGTNTFGNEVAGLLDGACDKGVTASRQESLEKCQRQNPKSQGGMQHG